MKNRLNFLKNNKVRLKKASFGELVLLLKDIIKSFGASVETFDNQNFFTCIIDNYKTLVYFISDVEQIETKHKENVLEIVKDLEIDKTIIVCNITGFDNYYISCLPIKGYLGADIEDVNAILDLLILEEEILSKNICCPYCGSNDYTVHRFSKEIFYDDIYDNFCELRGSLKERAGSFTDDLNITGLEFCCNNCKEEYTYGLNSEIKRDNFSFKTPIDRETYFKVIEEIFDETIAMIIKKSKYDAKVFYKEDLENLIRMKHEADLHGTYTLEDILNSIR